MESTKTITFRKPITVGTGDGAKTYESVTLREPLAGDYEAAEKNAGKYGFLVALIALISEVPIDGVDQMFSSQLDEAEDYFATFADGVSDPVQRSDDEMTLLLQQPVQLTEDKTGLNAASLDLCEPTNQQRRKARAAGGPFAASVALISEVAKVPKKTVRAMCARDFLTAVGYFNGFQIGRRPGSDD
ncbi:phage tail assembly protein [Burkholderia sp. AU42008]|uniref:phage tail assembly protein n=1 Tax=unclassified Burkholderia TaxID=2613784 RepID=UPI000B7AC861|nr:MULTISPECIES: phage tail assembly protein [unclassified Burkholderia]MBR8234601.1 phage tail assembly protein [Burkholderia sp. AU32357]MBY4875956.1 phage tail assembly protein [Burkholderia sp. AU42008]OXI44943.1 hypothetical protein CFB49_07755 [Burkholderia sp. AU17457]